MKSIDFKGAYMKIGAGQEEYNVIHAMPLDNPQGEVLAVYKLSDEERAKVAETGIIYYSRLTFGNQTVCKHCQKITPVGFQPFLMSIEPLKFNVKLSYENGEVIEVEAELREDGVHIPGYTKTPEGKYVKATEC